MPYLTRIFLKINNGAIFTFYIHMSKSENYILKNRLLKISQGSNMYYINDSKENLSKYAHSGLRHSWHS